MGADRRLRRLDYTTEEKFRPNHLFGVGLYDARVEKKSEMQQLTIRVTPEQANRLQTVCALRTIELSQRVTPSSFIRDLIEKALAQPEPVMSCQQ